MRKDEFLDEKGVVRKNMMTINQMEKYLLGRTFERVSHFYVAKINLGTQFVMVNIPTHQRIMITKIGNNNLQYKMLEIKPLEDSIMFYYDGNFEQLIEQNPSKKEKLLEMQSKQREEFKSNAEERLNGAVSQTYHFTYATKRILLNFMENLK